MLSFRAVLNFSFGRLPQVAAIKKKLFNLFLIPVL